jgi:hypothetical protein
LPPSAAETLSLLLRTWIARLMQAWDAERIDEQREILGKLGGG